MGFAEEKSEKNILSLLQPKKLGKNVFFLTGHFPRFPALGAYDAPMPACSQNLT